MAELLRRNGVRHVDRTSVNDCSSRGVGGSDRVEVVVDLTLPEGVLTLGLCIRYGATVEQLSMLLPDTEMLENPRPVSSTNTALYWLQVACDAAGAFQTELPKPEASGTGGAYTSHGSSLMTS